MAKAAVIILAGTDGQANLGRLVNFLPNPSRSRFKNQSGQLNGTYLGAV